MAHEVDQLCHLHEHELHRIFYDRTTRWVWFCPHLLPEALLREAV